VPADYAITVNSFKASYSPRRMIYILDTTGKEVFKHTFQTKNIYIHTSSYTNGYYIVKVEDNEAITTSKIIIRHY
jgi:hypothetical protein